MNTLPLTSEIPHNNEFRIVKNGCYISIYKHNDILKGLERVGSLRSKELFLVVSVLSQEPNVLNTLMLSKYGIYAAYSSHVMNSSIKLLTKRDKKHV